MRKLLAVAAIGLWTLVLSAQDPLTTGSVSGRVLDADTLAPLAGVSVGSREIGYVVTDQDGRYRFQGLKPGRLSFTIPSGYMQNPWPNKIVTVIAGREIAADFRYRLDAQFSGRVLDEDGNPMIEGLTDDDGSFLTRPLRPGRYVVLATDDPPPYDTIGPAGETHIQRSPEALSRVLRARSRGQSVELAPRTTIQVTLTPRTLE